MFSCFTTPAVEAKYSKEYDAFKGTCIVESLITSSENPSEELHLIKSFNANGTSSISLVIYAYSIKHFRRPSTSNVEFGIDGMTKNLRISETDVDKKDMGRFQIYSMEMFLDIAEITEEIKSAKSIAVRFQIKDENTITLQLNQDAVNEWQQVINAEK